METVIILPYPPSVNHYWRRVGSRTVISAEGRAYALAVRGEIMRQKIRITPGNIAVHITACPPDNRRRDLDNLQKSLLDSLQKAGAIEEDSMIDDLHIVRGEIMRPAGKVIVKIKPRMHAP